MGDRVRLVPFRRNNVDRVAHYIARKKAEGTDQFRDCCISCNITETVELRLDWQIVNKGWIERLRCERRPIVIVQMPRDPMGRADKYGEELLPDRRVYQAAIDRLKGRAFTVQVGAGAPVYSLNNIDFDLGNQTTVCDLLDIASIADGALGYCSFMAPLAESLNKPALFIWSRRGLKSRNEFIRQIVPEKIFNKQSSRSVVDDSTEGELTQSVDTFFEQIGSRTAV